VTITHGRYDTAVGATLARDLRDRGAASRRRPAYPQRSRHPGVRGRRLPERRLRRVAGSAAGTVFALGLIEAGASGDPDDLSQHGRTPPPSASGVAHSFNTSPREAALFYAANFGIAMARGGRDPDPPARRWLSIALNANVLATVLLPVSLVFMVMLANDKGLMGRWVNKRSDQRDRDLGDRVRRAVRCRLWHRLVPADDPSDRLMTTGANRI